MDSDTQDFINDLMGQLRDLEQRFRAIQATTNYNMEQLKLSREARARWEGTANILAGEIQKHMGTANMYKHYDGTSAIYWAWEQTSGDK